MRGHVTCCNHDFLLLMTLTSVIKIAREQNTEVYKDCSPDRKTFFKLFDENKLRILGIYAKAERDRLISVYKRTADTRIFNLFKKKYNILLYCPTGYYVNKDTTDFVWMSSETTKNSKGIIFFTEKPRA